VIHRANDGSFLGLEEVKMSRHHPFRPAFAPTDLQERLETALITGRMTRRDFMKAMVAAGLATTGLSALAQELDAIRANQEERAKSLQPEYDYVVVGTGSAACALVGRLAAASDANFLVIEAGEWDTAPSVLNPGVWFTNLGTERDWQHVAEPAKSTNNRAIPEHMAKVVGGGSSINATIWARPFKTDLEHWAAVSGDREWGYAHALATYLKVEDWQGKADPGYRGKGGPVWCEPSQNPHPMAPAMLAGCRSLGWPVLDDLNGRREESGVGFAMMNHIIKAGQRQSMARAYLYPVLSRKNVTLLVKAHVDRLTFAGTRATGVEINRGGTVTQISARSEVIVCAGGINTPKLLMLSGIGDEVELRKHGIKRLVHAREVGRNFQDHLLHGGCVWEPNEAMPHRNSAAEASGFWRSKGGAGTPDINLVQIELPYTSDVIGKQYAPPQSGWALCAGLVQPKSRGRLLLRSSNPGEKPIVDARFLSHPDDVDMACTCQ